MSGGLTIRDRLIERLAELEHQQWESWARAVAPEVSKLRRERWKEFFKPYSSLPHEVKELDREWARKVLAAIEDEAGIRFGGHTNG